MSPASHSAPGVSRLAAHREFVGSLLDHVPALHDHPDVTMARGKDAARTPAQLALQMVNPAWFADGISGPTRDRIVRLMQALPEAYKKLPAKDQSRLDDALNTHLRVLRGYIKGTCCVTHRRTRAVVDQILAFRARAQSGDLFSGLTEPESFDESSPKVVQEQRDSGNENEWEVVDKPFLDAPRKWAETLRFRIRRVNEEFDLVEKQINDEGGQRIMDRLESRHAARPAGSFSASSDARASRLKEKLEGDLRWKNALSVQRERLRQSLFEHQHPQRRAGSVSAWNPVAIGIAVEPCQIGGGG